MFWKFNMLQERECMLRGPGPELASGVLGASGFLGQRTFPPPKDLKAIKGHLYTTACKTPVHLVAEPTWASGMGSPREDESEEEGKSGQPVWSLGRKWVVGGKVFWHRTGRCGGLSWHLGPVVSRLLPSPGPR